MNSKDSEDASNPSWKMNNYSEHGVHYDLLPSKWLSPSHVCSAAGFAAPWSMGVIHLAQASVPVLPCKRTSNLNMDM